MILTDSSLKLILTQTDSPVWDTGSIKVFLNNYKFFIYWNTIDFNTILNNFTIFSDLNFAINIFYPAKEHQEKGTSYVYHPRWNFW